MKLMNSIIISAIIYLCKAISDKFLQSNTCALLMKVYNCFSKGWKNSRLVNIFGNTDKKSIVEESIFYKIFRLPFTFCETIGKKLGNYINKNIKTSFLCDCARSYLHNVMAVNTRFFGILVLCASVSFVVINAIASGVISVLGLIFGAVGAVLLMINYNIMSLMDGSVIIVFCKSIIGFKNVTFDFYDERYTKGVVRLIISALVGILTGIVMSVSPLYGILIPFAVFGGLLVLYAPITGVFAAVFLGAIIPTMLLAGVCIWTTISFVIKAITTENFKWRFEGVGLGIMLLLAILFVSSVMSFAMTKSLTVWAMYFVFMIFFFIFINVVETKEQLYAIIKVFIISGALVALYGIMQYVFGWTTTNAWIDEEMFEEQTLRVYSTLGNPNVLGEFLLLVLPFAAVQFIKNKANTLAKYGYLAMLGVLALCLVLTQSRGCWLGFILSVAVFVTFWEGRLWGIIPIIICILPFVLPQTVIDRLLSIGDMSDSSTSYRVFIWLGTLAMLKHYWIGGIGMGEGAFAAVYPFFSYNAIVAPHSHNTFLQLTVEAGVGALLLFVITQFVFIKGMAKVYRSNCKSSEASLTALAAASAILGFLLQSMFDYTFYNYRVMALFFMVLAMGVCLKYVGINSGKGAEITINEEV